MQDKWHIVMCCLPWQGFQGEFLWAGTSDMSAWLAVPAALRMLDAIGLNRLRKHNHDLLLEAAAMLSRAFGTQEVLGALPDFFGTAHPFLRVLDDECVSRVLLL